MIAHLCSIHVCKNMGIFLPITIGITAGCILPAFAPRLWSRACLPCAFLWEYFQVGGLHIWTNFCSSMARVHQCCVVYKWFLFRSHSSISTTRWIPPTCIILIVGNDLPGLVSVPFNTSFEVHSAAIPISSQLVEPSTQENGLYHSSFGETTKLWHSASSGLQS